MLNLRLLVFGTTLLLIGCTPTKPIATVPTIPLPTSDAPENTARPVYHASETQLNDLIHTKLEVSFDWKNKHVKGNAVLDLKPWFYATDSLILDAQGFDLHYVNLLSKSGQSPLQYTYDGKKIHIGLDKEYQRTDTFQIQINYTAKPEDLEFGGSSAIAADKGLYFIDPDDKDPNKRSQIWTQGETEANSCWFPTIDAPNEKMTQELFITVDQKYKTLSNGLLIFSSENGDGTRTDYWKQTLPHVPYLTMMAVGEFVEVKDTWRDSIEVSYLVEPEWEADARAIFGETPAMIEFFSEKLGYDYPWEKYHQVVVRDYVSGAMENTTATIHGDFLYRNKRELIDDHNESIIAHELFHHWFGDLVTCESWANLPLNESFATYSEYLWFEHRHGKMAADVELQSEMRSYLGEAQNKQEDMIRYDYSDREDMFDSHSYAKGGCILHMLRHHVGDDAFFTSLGLYLRQNEFKSVEIHQLRLAFEETTGEDLNWFFNQWFLSSGHPNLKIEYAFNDSLKEQSITITQQQDLKTTPLYRLPLEIDLFIGQHVERKSVVLDQQKQTFTFKADYPVYNVNVDADKTLLCEKTDIKPIEWLAFQYDSGQCFFDLYEALEGAYALERNKEACELIVTALSSHFPEIRMEALRRTGFARNVKSEAVKTKLFEMAANDPDAEVRAYAVALVWRYYRKEKAAMEVYNKAITDSSYGVMASGLVALYQANNAVGTAEAEKLQNEEGTDLLIAISSIYAVEAEPKYQQWYMDAIAKTEDNYDGDLIYFYVEFLKRQELSVVQEALPFFVWRAQTTVPYWMKLDGYRSLEELENYYREQAKSLSQLINQQEAKGGTTDAMNARQVQNKVIRLADDIKLRLNNLLKTEKDPNVLQAFE